MTSKKNDNLNLLHGVILCTEAYILYCVNKQKKYIKGNLHELLTMARSLPNIKPVLGNIQVKIWKIDNHKSLNDLYEVKRNWQWRKSKMLVNIHSNRRINWQNNLMDKTLSISTLIHNFYPIYRFADHKNAFNHIFIIVNLM